LVRFLLSARIAIDAFRLFLADDGWAIASHIALSVLMAFFPFLIVLAALAGFFGSEDLADHAAQILLDAWPSEVATPISAEIRRVLTTARGGALTIGVVFAVYFSSSGVESLRIGLNRAYDVDEGRPWWLLRIESVGYVMLAALALIAVSFLVVLEPLIARTVLRYAPALAAFERLLTFVRFGVAGLVLTLTLVVAHLWLPSGRRRFRDVLPGVIATLLLWLAGGSLFGRYLAGFADTYVTTYAGLATAMIALMFLYWSASIFIYGGELNAVIHRRHLADGDAQP
jgi:membrane protein